MSDQTPKEALQPRPAGQQVPAVPVADPSHLDPAAIGAHPGVAPSLPAPTGGDAPQGGMPQAPHPQPQAPQPQAPQPQAPQGGTPQPQPDPGAPGEVVEVPAVPIDSVNPTWGPVGGAPGGSDSPGHPEHHGGQHPHPQHDHPQHHHAAPPPAAHAGAAPPVPTPAPSAVGHAAPPAAAAPAPAHHAEHHHAVVEVHADDLMAAAVALRGSADELHAVAAMLSQARSGAGLSPALQPVFEDEVGRQAAIVLAVAGDLLEDADDLLERARHAEAQAAGVSPAIGAGHHAADPLDVVQEQLGDLINP
jgi:hypothetical protein